MNFPKILILILLFYFFALFQTTFLFYLPLVLISAVFINIFEKPRDFTGIFAGFVGGFFLDIFSATFIGFNVLILLVLAFFIKVILRKYVRNPVHQV